MCGGVTSCWMGSDVLCLLCGVVVLKYMIAVVGEVICGSVVMQISGAA